jgi:phage shock protein PspC (stress-responsive transcriptional regulator)
MTADEPKRLYRSRSDRKFAGVLGGVAEYFGFDPSWVRIGYTIVMILTGIVPLAFLYLVMAFVVPRAPKPGKPEPQS